MDREIEEVLIANREHGYINITTATKDIAKLIATAKLEAQIEVLKCVLVENADDCQYNCDILLRELLNKLADLKGIK